MLAGFRWARGRATAICKHARWAKLPTSCLTLRTRSCRRRWLRLGEFRCDNFPIESYACAEQLPSSYVPRAPPASAPPPSQEDVCTETTIGDAAGGPAAALAADGPTEKVPPAVVITWPHCCVWASRTKVMCRGSWKMRSTWKLSYAWMRPETKFASGSIIQCCPSFNAGLNPVLAPDAAL